MDAAMKARLQAAKEAEKRAQDMDGGEFPPDPPAGVYTATLQTCKVFVSSTGKPMCQRAFAIDGGESHGMQCKDFLNLEQDFLIARLRAFVEAHGYEMPAELFDYEQSEADDTWVFTQDVVDTVSTIEGEGRSYKIDFTQRQVGDRLFNSIAILEVGEEGSGGTIEEEVTEDGSAEETSKEEDAEIEAEDDEDEALRTELLAFCVDEGGVDDVDDSDDLAAVKGKISEYLFWPVGCDKAALQAVKDCEEADPADGVSAESIELLERAGLEACVVKPKATAKKTVAKKTVKKTVKKKK